VPYVGDRYSIIGAEVLVAGTTAAPNYQAFPGLCQCDTGDLLVSYMRATDHASTRNGNIVAKRSTDNGATWGAEFVIQDNANDLRDSDLVTLANGDIICSYTQYVGGDHDAYVTKSTDNGATWGTPVLVTSSLDSWTFICGRVIQLPNGDLLAPYYGRDSTDSLDRSAVSRSTDGGATWAALSAIDSGTFGRHAQEPVLAHDSDLDRIWCAVRSDGAQNRIYLFWSDDSGATWTQPTSAILTDSSGKPALIVTPEGALALAYRDGVNLAKLRWSFDKGSSWSAAVGVNSSAVYDYASWWNLSDGTLGLAWAVQQNSTDADVAFQRMSPPAAFAIHATRHILTNPGRSGGLAL
jgi:Neuraminidase (sialidase)